MGARSLRDRAPSERFAVGLNPTFKAVGALEARGAIGVVLPLGLDIAPVLTPLAAAGPAVLMVGAVVNHVRRGERQPLIANLVLLALAPSVAIGRGVELSG